MVRAARHSIQPPPASRRHRHPHSRSVFFNVAAIVFPPLAIGLYTVDGCELLINCVLFLFGWLPAYGLSPGGYAPPTHDRIISHHHPAHSPPFNSIIHALIVVNCPPCRLSCCSQLTIQ